MAPCRTGCPLEVVALILKCVKMEVGPAAYGRFGHLGCGPVKDFAFASLNSTRFRGGVPSSLLGLIGPHL